MKLVTKTLEQLRRWKEGQQEPDSVADAQVALRGAKRKHRQAAHKPTPQEPGLPVQPRQQPASGAERLHHLRLPTLRG